MAAPIGNDYNVKYKNSEARQGLCDRWCAHIAEGFSKQSFSECSFKTVGRYIDEFPEDFPSEKLDAAFAKNRMLWESIGMDLATGRAQHGKSSAWIFNMKNRFGDEWRDRSEVEHGGTVKKVTMSAEEYKVARAEMLNADDC